MKDAQLHLEELCQALIKINSVDDCIAMLYDLCTYKEIEQMAQRAYAAKLFLEGKTYNEIIAETNISSTTLSRISRAITHGNGAYEKFLDYEGKNEEQ